MTVPADSDRILVVDDDPGVRAALSRVLGRVGYALLGVASGEEALDALKSQRFACAVVDLRMPGMGGYGFIRRCRAQLPQMPIVVLTGHGDKQDVIECLRLGVADFVSKPWSDTELRSAVMRALELGGRPAPAAGVARAPTDAGGSAAHDGITLEVVKAVREGKAELPGIPEVALEARLLASSDRASAARMRDVVEKDPDLSRRILHLANNPYFLGYGKVTELQAAIARIGFREISNLLDTLVAHRLYQVPFPDPERREATSRIWRHSWARGIAMRFLAQERAELGLTPERAYLAGIFADVGAPYLLRHVTAANPKASFSEVMSGVAEHHAEVGELMAKSWELPPECRAAARRHHDPVPLERADGVLLCSWASEAICSQLGITGDPKPVPYQEEATRLLNITTSARALLVGKTNAYLEEVGQSIDGTEA